MPLTLPINHRGLWPFIVVPNAAPQALPPPPAAPNPISVAAIKQLATNKLRVTLGDVPVFSSDSSEIFGCLNPDNYVLTRVDGAWAPPVIRVDLIDFEGIVDLTTLTDLVQGVAYDLQTRNIQGP